MRRAPVTVMLNPRVKRAAGGSGIATSRSVQAQPPERRMWLSYYSPTYYSATPTRPQPPPSRRGGRERSTGDVVAAGVGVRDGDVARLAGERRALGAPRRAHGLLLQVPARRGRGRRRDGAAAAAGRARSPCRAPWKARARSCSAPRSPPTSSNGF
jgi:hypothetical protein